MAIKLPSLLPTGLNAGDFDKPLRSVGLPITGCVYPFVGTRDNPLATYYQSSEDKTVGVLWTAPPTADQDAQASTIVANAVQIPLPIRSAMENLDVMVGAQPVIVGNGFRLVTGHWLAQWDDGHSGGQIQVLARGYSTMLVFDRTNQLMLTMSIDGVLTLQRVSGYRNYSVSLSLFAR
jgi:hypothetical protein